MLHPEHGTLRAPPQVELRCSPTLARALEAGRTSMRGRIILCLAVSGLSLLTGCPGTIEDPLEFRRNPTGSTCPPDFDVHEDLLKPGCGALGCHTGDQFAAAGLDLTAPDVGDRILTHTSTQCEGIPLVDPNDIEGSYFNEKLDPNPSCGAQMPSGAAALNKSERACLNEYLGRLVNGETEPPADAGVVQ